jgi:hypothetical protein
MGSAVEVDIAAANTELACENKAPQSRESSTSPRRPTSGSNSDRRIPAVSNAETAAACEDNGEANEVNGSETCGDLFLVVTIAACASRHIGCSDWFTGVDEKHASGRIFP